VALELDHLVLPVADAARSIAFYARLLHLPYEGQDGQFSVLRVTPSFVLLLAPWPPEGSHHLAFAMTPDEFETTFRRIKDDGVAYGGSFDGVGRMGEPGEEAGARGMGRSVYFFDPDRHLLEIRSYTT